MSEDKNKGGRPRKISSPEEMDEKVDKYLKERLIDRKPITLTGIILELGLSSRESLDAYNEYEGFSDSVKRIKLIVENAYEINLHGTTSTGSIFALKNMGWKDKQELEHSGNIQVSERLSRAIERKKNGPSSKK